MRKYLVIFSAIIIFLFLVCMPGNVRAEIKSVKDAISGADSFLDKGKSETIINMNSLKKVSNNVFNILFVIGVSVSVVVIAIIGTKTLFGSIEEKSHYKEMLIPFVVGAVVVFGAYGIWKAVITILNKI